MRLPTFSSLLAFDAVARHGTLTSAAVELNVSQPAVSRRLAMLESDLGCSLFDRGSRPLAMTEKGETLFEVLRSGLSRLEVVVERLRSQADQRMIDISAGSGFANFALIPRLDAMQAAFPDLTIRVISQSHSEDETVGDLQVRFGDGDWPGIDAVKVFGEEVFPVCSPLFLKGGAAPRSIEELLDCRLLRNRMERQPWYEWESWLEAVGVRDRSKLQTLDFDSYALIINAALAGQGVCLCWSGLAHNFLDSGALLRLTDLSATASRGYFVTCRSDLPASSPIRGVAAWLIEAVKGSADDPAG